jgi:hypothetical protein
MQAASLSWQLTKSEFFAHVGTANGRRALFHHLVIITQQGGKDGGRATKVDTDSAREFYEKWIRSGKGDDVPRLPCERPARARRRPGSVVKPDRDASSQNPAQ